MTDLGLRGAEIVELWLEDIDWRAGTLVVRKNKQRRERLLPLPRLVAKAILNYLRTGRPSSSSRRLFLCHRLPVGQPMGLERLRGAVRRIMRRSGLNDVPAASAILDRLLHHAEIIPINGRSYRLQSKAKRAATPERSAFSSSSPNPA